MCFQCFDLSIWGATVFCVYLSEIPYEMPQEYKSNLQVVLPVYDLPLKALVWCLSDD